MIHDAAVLVPPAPLAPLGAMAAAALLAGSGRSVLLLEPTPADGVVEPFLLPLPAPVRPASGRAVAAALAPDGADGLLTLVTTAARLPPPEELLERLPVPCQLVLPRHRLDFAADPAAFAVELAREWPDAADPLAALERQLADLDAAVAAAPPRLLTGTPTRLGMVGDTLALFRSPRSWLRGVAALGSPLPALPAPAAGAVATLTIALGGLAEPPSRLGDLWRPWAAARRGGRPRPGAPGLVARLRAQAIAAGAAAVPYDPDRLRIEEGSGALAVRLGEAAPVEARLLVSGWPAAGLAPQVAGRLGTQLGRLAAAAVPRRWAARLTVEAPAGCLPVGLRTRALLAGGAGEAGGDNGDGGATVVGTPGGGPARAPDPLLLEVGPVKDGRATLALTALVDTPAADSGLAGRLRQRLEWLVPFLPPEAPHRLTPPDPRWPARFAAGRARPFSLPPLAGRRIALVGPDVAPLLGPEGEALAALGLVHALAPAGR